MYSICCMRGRNPLLVGLHGQETPATFQTFLLSISAIFALEILVSASIMSRVAWLAEGIVSFKDLDFPRFSLLLIKWKG